MLKVASIAAENTSHRLQQRDVVALAIAVVQRHPDDHRGQSEDAQNESSEHSTDAADHGDVVPAISLGLDAGEGVVLHGGVDEQLETSDDPHARLRVEVSNVVASDDRHDVQDGDDDANVADDSCSRAFVEAADLLRQSDLGLWPVLPLSIVGASSEQR